MLAIYIACLIFGGVLLVFTMFGGGDSDSADDVHIDSGDTHIEIDHSGDSDIVHTGAADIDHDSHGSHDAADAVRFISFRNLTYFLTFFGLSGTVLDLVDVPSWITLGGSVLIGSFAAVFGYQLMKYLRGSESGDLGSIYELKGREAVALMPAEKGKRTKISVTYGARTITLMAKLADISEAESINKGDKILIIDIGENNTCEIVKSDL